MARVTEDQVAEAVMRIAAAQANGVATFNRIRKELPNLVALDPADKALSQTRRKEPMWHQLMRNIRSHYANPGNAIYEGWLQHVARVGYRITPVGQQRLEK